MELNEVIIKRRTVRDFLKKPVPDSIVNKALKAGLKAPSYNHMKQWDFILVDDDNLRYALTQTEKMNEVVSEEIKNSFSDYEDIAKDMYLDAIPKQRKMIMDAPRLLVVVYKPKTPVEKCNRVYDLNGFASIWCCIENILLSLAEDDVFGVTFIPKNTSAIKQILDIPDQLEVASIIPFGYKATSAKIISQKDIELNNVLHTDKW